MDIPIASIHPEAFESSKSRLRELRIGGGGSWGWNPITKFPIGLFENCTSLEHFGMQGTSINDETFMDEEHLFSDIELPNLSKYHMDNQKKQ